MKSLPCLLLLIGLAVSTAIPERVTAEDWPQFLGASRNGVSSETGLIDSIDAQSPAVVWRVPGGVGMSAVAVAGDRAVTMWNAEGQQWLVALDVKTGNTVWKTPLADQYGNSMGDGPRATPAIAGSQVFAYTGEGVLAAVDLATGNLKWKATPVRDNQIRPSEYGMSSSPLVVDGRVIVHAGGTDSNVVAYDTATGKRIWTSGSGTAGYSSPTLLDVGGTRQLVCFTGAGVIGIDPANGKQLWEYPFKTPYDCNTATPVSVEGGIFISAGENHGSVLLDVKSHQDSFQVSERWASLDPKSVMRNEWQTSVLVGDYLYGFDNVGSAGPITHLKCIQASTGEPIWQKTRFGKGNLTLADGKLWITTMEGELVLVRATPEAYEELGRATLFGKTRQSLSISGGLGFIRDDQDVVCVKLSKS